MLAWRGTAAAHMIPRRLSSLREHIMWLTALAALALLTTGNLLRRSGVEAARAALHGSAAALAGRRKSGIGNWLNLAGGVCLLAALGWTWL
jgi:hypothetical protein